MSLIINSVTIELYWGRFAYFSGGGRDIFIEFHTGLPFGFFSKEREGVALELWGFGMKLVTSPS